MNKNTSTSGVVLEKVQGSGFGVLSSWLTDYNRNPSIGSHGHAGGTRSGNDKTTPKSSVAYYESRKRELKTRPIYECR
jgi:hypothetical protein